MSKAKDCELDKWTRNMLEQHPSFDDALFKHKLLLLGITAVKDIAPIEARHASIRRVLKVLSTQTHSLDFADLDARWIFLQARGRTVDAAPGQRSKFEARASRQQLLLRAERKST